MTTYIAFNLWDADILGNGETKGKTLTAYLGTMQGTNTSKFVSVPLTNDEFAKLTDEPDAEDEWHYAHSPRYPELLEIMITKLIERA